MGKTILIKEGEEKKRKKVDGKLFRLLTKSKNLESIIAELDIGAESETYQHKGEELHLILDGKIKYIVGEKSYTLFEGDVLWHPSDINHQAKNIGQKKAKYLTVSTPPTFM